MRHKCYICTKETTSNLDDNAVILGAIICNDCMELASESNILRYLVKLYKKEEACFKCPDFDAVNKDPFFEETSE